MDLTFKDIVEIGSGTPVLIIMAYVLYRIDKKFAKLVAQMKAFKGMPSDDNE